MKLVPCIAGAVSIYAILGTIFWSLCAMAGNADQMKGMK